MTFGTYLHQWRAAHALSRKVFADELGITLDHLSELELNRAQPTCAEIERMATLLHLPSMVLMAQAGYVRRAAFESPMQAQTVAGRGAQHGLQPGS